MPELFLSYSREDQATARRFAEAFQRAGFSVWWDQALNPGEAFDDVTEKALEESKAVVVLWSKASVASRWVRAEATQASSSGKLVPVMIEACKRPIMFELTHTADLSGWKGNEDDSAWIALRDSIRRMAGSARPDTEIRSSPGSARSTRPLPFALAGAALLLLAGGAWWLLAGRHPSTPAEPAPATAATGESVTIAVLPFTNLSDDPARGHVATGLTEDLTTQLSQIRALRVTAPESSFRFKGSSEDPRAIGKALGVSNLVTGSLQWADEQARITVRLIDARDGTTRWTKPYQSRLEDAFVLQQQIAQDVAREVGIVLDASDLPRAQGGTSNVKAHDLYWQAIELARTANVFNLPRIVPLLREAARLDPDFQLAAIQLQSSLRGLAMQQPAEATALLAEADAVSQRLHAMQPESAQIAVFRFNEQLGNLISQRRWAEAFAVLESSPRSPAYVFAKASLLEYVGRVREAIPFAQRVLAQDPLNAQNAGMVGYAQGISGEDPSAAGKLMRQAIDAAGKSAAPLPVQQYFTQLGISLLRGEGVDALKRILKGADGRLTWPFAGKPASILDDRNARRAAMQQALGDPEHQGEAWTHVLTMTAAILGESDLGVEFLRHNILEVRAGWPLALWAFPSFRNEPGYRQLIRDLKLDEYWRSSGKWSDFCQPVGTDDFECH